MLSTGTHHDPRQRTGRFAPSPTGPLHLGSLVAAVASFVDARSQGGRWLVRIEDVDTPRTVHGAADAILRTLESYGLHWDGEVVYQSRRIALYEDALRQLGGSTFGCGCTRQDPVCHCAEGLAGRVARSTKVRWPDGEAFTVKRADGLFAYQLAVVVDDDAQGVTDVVRGADLLDSTPRQLHLQRLLGYRTPRYLHVPVVTDAHGDKLSKQTRAPAIVPGDEAALRAALQFLGHTPPAGAPALAWAIAHWDPRRIAADTR
ncbi:MAG: glutamate--tRNA ligase family protein [Acidobacteria bacterium]|nr:glutamate--tRNA ligase family protein [Acidobacteriota bacterium]